MRFGKGIRILATSFVMALPLAQAADCGAPVIEVVDAAALKGIKRVAVTSFTVQYVTSQVWDTSFTSGGTGYGVKGPLCLLYTSPSPRDRTRSRMPSSA